VLTALVAAGGAVAVVVAAARVGGVTAGTVTTEEWLIAIAAAGIAVTAMSFSVVAAPMARLAAATISVLVLLGVLGGGVSLAARAMAILAGGVVGASAALLLGTRTRRIARTELAAAMAEVHLPVAELDRHGGDARGSQPWIATLATDRQVFVKVTAVDELRSDQLFRLWRRLILRRADDERSPGSVRRAVEHEAFVAQAAAAAGVNTPSVLRIGSLGVRRGMFAVFSNVDGSSLDDIDDPGEPVLRSAWSQVQILRRARIAHRDLRAANVMVSDGEAHLIDFGFAEIAATQDLLDRDLAELLASTAAGVGVERAVSAAVAVLGPDELVEAIPWLQPLGVCAASRHALDKADFEALREAVRAAAGISAPELPQLRRVSPKALLATLALGVAVWTLLPQLTSGIDWSTVLEASPGWAAAAVLASALTYVGAAVSMAGSVRDSVPLPAAFFAQIASSFTNRITPAKVGGLALNVRFLTKQGIDTASATTGVAVSPVAGAVVHVTMMVVAVLWAGNVGLPGMHLPSARVALLVAVALGLLAVVVAAVPALRTWCTEHAVPAVRRSLRSFVEVLRTPRNVAMLLGGSAIVTVANLAAFDVSLRAFGVHLPASTTALVFLAGSALAQAVPTPGGLGAAEAALVAGLVVVSVEEQVAIPAVLLFRLATFWLPIVPGWLAFTVLQRRGAI
jgi:undecaprenyl-diphosphatase